VKLFFALIGDPQIYQRVNYIFNEKLFNERTSINVLIKEINFNKVFIFAPESLFIGKISENKNEIFKYVEEEIRKFFRKEGLKIEFDVIVSLSSGRYKDKNSNIIANFQTDFSNYYYFLIKIFYDIFKSINDKKIEIYVDITHGLNSFVAFFQIALLEFLKIVAMFKDIEIYIYNSDPYSPLLKEQCLNINLVRKMKIKAVPYFQKINDNLDVFIGAIYNGLPLLGINFFPDINRLKKEVEEKFTQFNTLNITKKEDEFYIRRKSDLNEEFKGKVISLFLAEQLNKNFFVNKKNHLVFKIKKNYKTNKFDYFESNEIKNLKKFFKFDERIGVRINKDIKNLIFILRKNLNKIDNNKVSIACLKEEAQLNPIFNERNFLAHSGFENNAVLVSKVNNEIIIEYDINYIDKIKEAAKKGLLD
jgi:CRISPR-associated protein Csx1